MKTPNRIAIIYDNNLEKYNAETGDYEISKPIEIVEVPCLANYLSQSQTFREYGTTNEKILTVRFQQEIPRFNYAIYEGEKYEILDMSDMFIKGAVRLKRMSK